MSTMKEVARQAGVSVATVSHVVNSTRFVSPELVDRVRSAMTALDYTPDATARSLRVRRTLTLGLVVPDNSNPFFAELARLIEDEGFRSGYTTILGNSTEQPEREWTYVHTLISKRVDGLILAPCRNGDGSLEPLLRRAGVPVVVIDRDIPLPGADVVTYDNYGGGRSAVEHLLELGHERIACIGGPADVGSARERVRGYHDALAAAGIDAPDSWIFRGDFRFAGGRAAAAALAVSGERFSAVFAVNDLMAAGAMTELATHGLRVPGDVSVVGFDDAPLAVMVSPALTTVCQPLGEMARTAVSLLLARVRGDDGSPPQRHVLPTRLVVRQSATHARARHARRRKEVDSRLR